MVTCVPSYGRDYKTAKQVKEAWAAGHDFTIQDMTSPHDGRQINKEDADRADLDVVIYFAKTTKLVVIASSGRSKAKSSK